MGLLAQSDSMTPTQEMTNADLVAADVAWFPVSAANPTDRAGDIVEEVVDSGSGAMAGIR